MGVSFIVVIVLNLLALAILGMYVYRLDLRVEGIIQDAIAKELRLQDDRIQKRMERADGRSADMSETAKERQVLNETQMKGQPFRR